MPRILHQWAVIGLTGGLLLATISPAAASPTTPGDTPRATQGPCQYTETPDEPAARKVPLPPDPHWTPTFDRHAVLKTNHGEITLTLTGD